MNAEQSSALYTHEKYDMSHAVCFYFEDARTCCLDDCQNMTGENMI